MVSIILSIDHLYIFAQALSQAAVAGPATSVKQMVGCCPMPFSGVRRPAATNLSANNKKKCLI
jgi:hypothetical protein